MRPPVKSANKCFREKVLMSMKEDDVKKFRSFEMAGSSADDYISMKCRSLILSAPREGRFFLREYFPPSLQSVIGKIPDNVVSFGPLATNNEWHIVLKSEDAKNKLLSAGQLHVNGVVVFWVRSADSD